MGGKSKGGLIFQGGEGCNPTAYHNTHPHHPLTTTSIIPSIHPSIPAFPTPCSTLIHPHNVLHYPYPPPATTPTSVAHQSEHQRKSGHPQRGPDITGLATVPDSGLPNQNLGRHSPTLVTSPSRHALRVTCDSYLITVFTDRTLNYFYSIRACTLCLLLSSYFEQHSVVLSIA